MSVTVMNISNPSNKLQLACNPREAVISAYAHSKHDGNTWQYAERYEHMVIEGKFCIACGDFSAFKDGREF